jgi:hypothetical protein
MAQDLQSRPSTISESIPASAIGSSKGLIIANQRFVVGRANSIAQKSLYTLFIRPAEVIGRMI